MTDAPTRSREVGGILLFALALFLLLSLGSLAAGVDRLMGPVGAAVGLSAYAALGVSAFVLAYGLGHRAVDLFRGRPFLVRAAEISGFFGGLLALAVLFHLPLASYRLHGYAAGGLIGEYSAELLRSLVGTAGTVLLGLVGLALAIVACTPLTMRRAGRGLWQGLRAIGPWTRHACAALFPGDEAEEESPAEKRDAVPLPAIHVPRKSKRDEDLTQRTPTLEVEAVPVEAMLPLATEPSPPPEIVVSATPEIVAPLQRKSLPVRRAPPEPEFDATNYKLPELVLLDYDDPGHGEIDKQAMLELASRLEKTLGDYGVRGRVSEIHPGPVVTMYEFVPQAGTKLTKITALANDLAMALEALKVRIVAPIPGKAAVGIEVPNKHRETVYLKEIIGDESFGTAKSKLTLALGRDISGRPVCVDLARMPHLLIAGTTGSGKSVSVNGMICSLLFNATPDEVKLIMIDPKMLELSIYEGIPHLLLPVVTDPKKANLALRWAVDEMERRYDLISKSGVRDIASYNKKLQKHLDEGTEVTPPSMLEETAAPPKRLPYIVVIIDEFADLMMVASKEVETSVARIAQKARAAGIHLLLATQRPSVDVITGLIKANFPSRIAFQVASKIDARTILDQQGAESLLGMGDMLFTDRGLALRRIHGPLVTDVEIRRVVDCLKAQGRPVYDLDILKPRADEEGGEEGGENLSDAMYDQAVAIVAETRQASISMIQRRLRIGYNRAARMVERMEREGIVGPAEGAKPREVMVAHHAA